MRYYIQHANSHNHEFGLLLRQLEHQRKVARKFLEHVFSDDTHLIDWQGALWFLASGRRREIRQLLYDELTARIIRGGRTALVTRLRAIKRAIVLDEG